MRRSPLPAGRSKQAQAGFHQSRYECHASDAGRRDAAGSHRKLSDCEVEAVIADSGPGIPKEIQKKIFAPFFTTKKEGEGTGLGLYICRNIVDEHEGRLLLHSDGRKGTTFRIVLPI